MATMTARALCVSTGFAARVPQAIRCSALPTKPARRVALSSMMTLETVRACVSIAAVRCQAGASVGETTTALPVFATEARFSVAQSIDANATTATIALATMFARQSPLSMAPADEIRSGYERYGPALLRKAERILRNPDDACDIVQSLFVELHQNDRHHRAGDLPYLYRAVTNRCLNLIRDTKRRTELLAQEGSTQPLPSSRTEQRALSIDLLAKLTARLDDKCMEALVCRFVDDMTQDEIAAHLNTSRKTVGKRLAKVRAALEALS